jgi:D-glycero-alpha-D-manno-heptose-7-phosphate kinase
VLGEQKANTGQRLGELEQMRDLAYELQRLLREGDISATDIGRLLDRGWQLKRKLADTVTTNQIDEWYDTAMKAGASGGKLCGAGGGGFLLVIVPPERREHVVAALSGLRPVTVRPESHGSQIMLPLMD